MRAPLRLVLLDLWFVLLAFVGLLIAGVIARAIGGTPGVLVGVLCFIVLMLLGVLATAFAKAALEARRSGQAQ